MKTPTPNKSAGGSIVKCGRSKGSICVTTPEKGKISRHFQSLGGESVRGAASATARHFNLHKTSGARMVKKYDNEIRDGCASRANRKSTGRPKQFNADIEAEIIDAWDDDDTRTYREVAKEIALPRSTLHRYATKDMDFRCLGTTVRPMPSDANQEGKRGGGARRVHMDASYAPLRARLGIRHFGHAF